MDELRDFNALNLAMIPFDEQDCIVDNQFFLAGDFGEAGPSRNYSSDPSMVPILTAPYPFKIQAAMMQLCLGGRMRVRLNLNEYELHRNSLLIVTPGSIGQCLDISADCRIVLIALSNSYIIRSRTAKGRSSCASSFAAVAARAHREADVRDTGTLPGPAQKAPPARLPVQARGPEGLPAGALR